ncbi:hypothetical protein PIB30_032266 [Stylosanthes scabra]|uniref:Uncharacterized protein n=1 Tax=Stylosanthes scabra TaxID=79078 RepID=A0ABU6X9U0_9FABA|nr:hypothetical protein [Stylosanthes scabra]
MPGLLLPISSSLHISKFSDSNWARCPDIPQVRVLKLHPVPCFGQLADIFTKPLAPGPFTMNLSKLRVLDDYHPLACRGVLKQPQAQQQQPQNSTLAQST